jgi:hypothetical protein
MSERIKQLDSPHNACAFRADCRKAEALLAERDDEIARLRKILGWVAQNPEERAYWLGSVTALELDVKDDEIARLRDVLASKGFVECGIPACDCRRLREDAERYRWLRPRIHGFDADVCHGGLGVVFKFPENSRVGIGASLDAAIDAARKERE